MSTRSRYGSTKYHLLLCPECPRTGDEEDLTYDVADLQDHLSSDHLEDFYTYRCPNCPRTFSSAYRAKKHTMTCARDLFSLDQDYYTRPLAEISQDGLKKINHWIGVAIKIYGMQERQKGLANVNQSMHNSKQEEMNTAAPMDRNNNRPLESITAKPEVRLEVMKETKQPDKYTLPEITRNSSLSTLRSAQRFLSTAQITEMNDRGEYIVHDKTIDYTPSAPPLDKRHFHFETLTYPSCHAEGTFSLSSHSLVPDYNLGSPVICSSPYRAHSRPAPIADLPEISLLGNEICQEIKVSSPVDITPFSCKSPSWDNLQGYENLNSANDIEQIVKGLRTEYKHGQKCVQNGLCDRGCPKIKRIEECILADDQFLSKLQKYSPNLYDKIRRAYGQ